MKILFLYTELAEYFLKCCETLSNRAEVHIVHWPVNNEAPFEFSEDRPLHLYNRKDYPLPSLRELIVSIQPDSIVCSGWIDKEYLRACRPYFGKVPTVLTCDTRWTGGLKQQLARILSRIFLLNTFSHIWVPGESQKKYALKLGFKPEKIRQGFYCCDLTHFNRLYEKRKAAPYALVTKRFLYIGRYYEFKGLPELWTAFENLDEHGDWELWCLGTGSLPAIEHPRIRHFGFVQPSELEPILEQTSAFILPSRFEPWAVVVQEMAAAGFPMILSDAVGASEKFLVEGKNGFLFKAGNSNDLENQMKKVIHLSVGERTAMSEASHTLAQQITPQTWVASLLEMRDGIEN